MTIRIGTKCIFRGAVNRPKHSSKYAGQLGLPTVAWLILPSDLTMPDLVGRWKQFSNMLTNGSRRNGEIMETHTAQGFLRLSLNVEEANLIIRCAKKAGRYLIPLEISKILKRDIKKTLTDVEEQRMEDCWLSFCKSNDTDQRTGCTDPDVLEQWYRYVSQNYQEPLPEASPWGGN